MRTSRLLWIGSCSLLALIAAAGCGDVKNGRPDTAVDTRPAEPDGGPGVEAGPEAMRDLTAEVDRDLALDTGIEASGDAPFPPLDGPTGYEVTAEVTGETKGPTPDTQGPDGGVLASCTGDPTALIWSDPRYRCGNCESDMLFPLVCRDGYLACATSYRGSGDVLVSVPTGAVVLDGQDPDQCAYMQPYYYPGFALWDPKEGVSAGRDPRLPIKLHAITSYAPLPARFRTIFDDRATGEAVIRSLVKLTEVTRGAAIDYEIGIPYVKDTATTQEVLELTPTQPLVPGTKYRITLYPGTAQQLVKCHTFGRTTFLRGTPDSALTAPETTDFTTAGSPASDAGS